MEGARTKAIVYCDKVKPFMDLICDDVDCLELMVDDKEWPLTKYREMVSLR